MMVEFHHHNFQVYCPFKKEYGGESFVIWMKMNIENFQSSHWTVKSRFLSIQYIPVNSVCVTSRSIFAFTVDRKIACHWKLVASRLFRTRVRWDAVKYHIICHYKYWVSTVPPAASLNSHPSLNVIRAFKKARRHAIEDVALLWLPWLWSTSWCVTLDTRSLPAPRIKRHLASR